MHGQRSPGKERQLSHTTKGGRGGSEEKGRNTLTKPLQSGGALRAQQKKKKSPAHTG